MTEIFKMVFVTSLYASVVGLVIILAKSVLKNKLSPQWHYLIWVVLILKLLVPFGPQSAVSLFNTVPPVQQSTDSMQPYDQIHEEIVVSPQENSHISASYEAEDEFPGLAAVAERAVGYVWLLGVVLMSAWLFYTNRKLHKKLKCSDSPVPESLYAILEKCKEKIGVRANIEIVIQNDVGTPALFGVFQPKILLSRENLETDNKNTSYIFLHELAHYQRKDLLANYLLLVVQVIHWFNPIIWFCFKRIRQDMELAADAKVLNVLEGDEQKEYGKALLLVLERFNTSKLAPRLVGMVDDKENIARRIKTIKMADFFKSRKRMVITTGILCIVVLSVFLLTSALPGGTFCELGKYTLQVPSDWKVTNSEGQLLFEKNGISIGGVQIVGLEPGQPLNLPNHSKTKSKKDIEGLITEAVLLNLDMSEPAAAQDASEKNENHLYLTFTDDGNAYDIYADTRYVKEAELLKIGETLQKAAKIESAENENVPTIEEAVSRAIENRNSQSYHQGEAFAEGHTVLEIDEKEKITTVYAVASCGWFGFENGIFTKISGCGVIPTVIKFTKNVNGEYSLLDYKEPLDGELYTKSIKEMFPERLWDSVFKTGGHSSELVAQQEEQARRYLQSIGRDAEVRLSHVDKNLADIDVQASNKLFSEFTKYDAELNNFPYWLGTKEMLVNGVRYVYETSQSKTDDGCDLIIFRKTKKEDGTVVKEYLYKIVGSEPQLIKE